MGVDVQAIFFYGYVQKEEADIAWENAYNRLQEQYPAFSTFEQKSHLVFGSHGGIYIPYHYIAIKEAHFLANADMLWPHYPKRLRRINTEEIKQEWRERLDTFIDEYEIEIEDQEPGWFLVAYGG